MKTAWLSVVLSMAMTVPATAFGHEADRGDSGDPHEAAPTPTKRRSPGLMAGGIVMVTLGSLSSIVGAGFLIGQTQGEAICASSNEVLLETGGAPLDCSTDPTETIVGVSMLAGGIAMLAGGVPMIVIGKERVPDPGATIALGARAGGATMEVTVSF